MEGLSQATSARLETTEEINVRASQIGGEIATDSSPSCGWWVALRSGIRGFFGITGKVLTGRHNICRRIGENFR